MGRPRRARESRRGGRLPGRGRPRRPASRLPAREASLIPRRLRLLAIAAVGFAIGAWAYAAEPPQISHAPAAPFRTKALTGETLDLAELRARGPVVIDFWATWCQPCTQALPELERVHQAWKERGVTVIGVSIDGPRNQARVRPFAAKLGLHFPMVFDADGSLQRHYQVQAVPTTVVVDTSGAIAYASEGWWPGETKKLEQALASLLPSPSEPARP